MDKSRHKGTTRRHMLRGAAAAGMAVLTPQVVRSQEKFPARTITIVVPFPAGATTDMLARLFAQRMSETMGQTVLVENVGGAGGSLGADKVAKAAADGHTLLFHNITFTTTTRRCNMPVARAMTSSRISSRSPSGPTCSSGCWRIFPSLPIT